MATDKKVVPEETEAAKASASVANRPPTKEEAVTAMKLLEAQKADRFAKMKELGVPMTGKPKMD